MYRKQQSPFSTKTLLYIARGELMWAWFPCVDVICRKGDQLGVVSMCGCGPDWPDRLFLGGYAPVSHISRYWSCLIGDCAWELLTFIYLLESTLFPYKTATNSHSVVLLWRIRPDCRECPLLHTMVDALSWKYYTALSLYCILAF